MQIWLNIGIYFYFKELFYNDLIINTSSVLVTIELQSKEDISGISWSLLGTNCKSLPNLSVSANRLIKQNCVLAVGKSYTLTCEGPEEGWVSSYLVIENRKYCEYTGLETTVNITITGKLKILTLIDLYL